MNIKSQTSGCSIKSLYCKCLHPTYAQPHSILTYTKYYCLFALMIQSTAAHPSCFQEVTKNCHQPTSVTNKVTASSRWTYGFDCAQNSRTVSVQFLQDTGLTLWSMLFIKHLAVICLQLCIMWKQAEKTSFHSLTHSLTHFCL